MHDAAKPTSAQVIAARVRAAVEVYEKKHRKPCGGGWKLPPRAEMYKAVAEEVGVSVRAISYCLTYARQCTHPWSEGACPKCPSADHIPWD